MVDQVYKGGRSVLGREQVCRGEASREATPLSRIRLMLYNRGWQMQFFLVTLFSLSCLKTKFKNVGFVTEFSLFCLKTKYESIKTIVSSQGAQKQAWAAFGP